MRPPILAVLLLLGACAELTTPRPPEPPVELAGLISAAPLRQILDAAVADFDQAGAGLAGRPAATALAAARLEWIGGEFRPGRRLALLPDSFRFGAQRAVAEGREILGISRDATPEAAVSALLAVSRALAQGDQTATQAALASPVFAVGQGRPMQSRLREPGVFPDAALVTVALRDEVSRLVAEGRTDLRVVSDNLSVGFSTTGLGPGTGY